MVSRDVIAIDPGGTGAICLVTAGGSVRFWDTPVIAVTRGKKTRNEPDEQGMLSVLIDARQASRAGGGNELATVIEKVNAMPSIAGKRSMGATSAFSFGMGYGMWRMACASLQLPYRLVHPATWKKVVLAGAPKDGGAEAIIAGQLYPAAAAELRGPRGGIRDGRVDALLIAHWARSVP